jgi:hypothetical protein
VILELDAEDLRENTFRGKRKLHNWERCNLILRQILLGQSHQMEKIGWETY